MITIKDIDEAAQRLQPVVHNIPLSSSTTFSGMTGAEVFLKCENQQKTGSFKVRGAYNKIMKLYEAGGLKSVIASSAGNHAQGVAFAARQIGIPATICMPRSTPIAKVSATKGYGANVVLSGSCYDDAYAKAMEIVEETGATFIHPFDDEDVMAGQGTIGMEILRDQPAVDVILVPAGGGGLLSGVAACVKQINPRIEVIGVQAEGAPAIVNSFHQDSILASDAVHTIADGIAVKCPGTKTMEHINAFVDDMVTVSDDDIAATILQTLFDRGEEVLGDAAAEDFLGEDHLFAGRVMGMTPTGNGEQVIEAECPEAELMSYAIDLRSMTQSRGSFVMHFVRYEQCSADAQAKAVAAAKAMQEAE